MEERKMSFEEALKELEAIVEKLEKGDLTLDESINAFQRGIEISKYCNKKLDEVERKITLLIENENGEIQEKEFAVTDGL